MSARRPAAWRWAAAGMLAFVAAAVPAQEPGVLRVCADPNNLPFSHRDGSGLENRLVALLARELGLRVQTTWWAQRRGFLRNTLLAGTCDVVPGVVSQLPMLSTTRPYYRSAYVFLQRRDGRAPFTSLDDPRLREVRVGVQLIGDDGANTPPVHALARRGIFGNLTGYSVLGDYRDPAPQRAIVDAVARGDVDVALAWGPVAGYFATRAAQPMRWQPVTPWLDGPQWPMVFEVSMGVRKEDRVLRRALDRAMRARRAEIDALLAEFAVPVPDTGTRQAQ